MTTIKDYNDNLINQLINIELIDYFKNVHSKYYKHIDISFMDYFLSLCDRDDEFCVEHTKLKEYNVINNINSSTGIIRCLNQYDLVENVDYSLVRNVAHQSETSRGIKYINKYLLKPDAFKICLMRAKILKYIVNIMYY